MPQETRSDAETDLANDSEEEQEDEREVLRFAAPPSAYI